MKFETKIQTQNIKIRVQDLQNQNTTLTQTVLIVKQRFKKEILMTEYDKIITNFKNKHTNRDIKIYKSKSECNRLNVKYPKTVKRQRKLETRTIGILYTIET